MRILKHPLLGALVAAVWFWAPTIEILAIPLWTAGAGGGGSAAPGFTLNTAIFDGTTDYIRSTTSSGSGLADGNQCTLTFWMKPASLAATMIVLSNATSGTAERFNCFVNTSGQIRFRANNDSTVTVVDLTSSATVSTGVWTHVGILVDTTTGVASANTKMFINGVEDTSMTENTLTENATIDFLLTANRFTVGGSIGGTPAQLFNGSLAGLFFDDSLVTDISKFISGGRPVDPGTNASAITGSTPVLYFSTTGSGDTWATNNGTFGTWTRSGNGLGTDTSP